MNTSGAREERPPEEWDAHADVIRFVQDQHIRESLVLGLERDKEAHVMRARQGRRFEAFKEETARREVANLGDHAMIMRSLGRIESALDVHGARLDGVVVHLAGAERDIGALGRESAEHAKAEREISLKLSTVEAAAAEERARMAERANSLERRVSELTGAVGDAAKDGAVAKFVAREALTSVTNEAGEVADAKKGHFELKKIALWLVAALVLTGVGTALRVHYGADNVPQIAAPAAPH